MIETLGTGSYGKVKLCENTQNSKMYAIKIICRDQLKKKNPNQNPKTAEMLDDMVQDMKFLTEMKHMNVIKLHEIIDDP